MEQGRSRRGRHRVHRGARLGDAAGRQPGGRGTHAGPRLDDPHQVLPDLDRQVERWPRHVGRGAVGLIKTVLQLRHRELYPTLHFDVPNPIIDFESTAVFVNRDYRSWPAPAAGPRLAGVTSLGASGTNVHVVVAEAPTRPATPASDVQVLVPLSAHTRASLDAQRVVLRAALFAQRPALADVALTLGAGRKHHRYRLVYRARSLDELIERLAEPATPTAVVQPKIVWLLSDHARAVSPDPTDETTTSGDDADPRGALFLRQHRALARLSELGLDTRHLAPVGVGAWVARAMTGQLSVEAALARRAALAGSR